MLIVGRSGAPKLPAPLPAPLTAFGPHPILRAVKLSERVALVTGAAGRGIGRAIALALAHEGAHVAVSARTGAELDAVAAEIRGAGAKALAVTCDVGERAEVEDAVRQVAGALGPVGILVNNAGVASLRQAGSTPTTRLWEQHPGVNLTGGVPGDPGGPARAAGRARWGRIINVASIARAPGVPLRLPPTRHRSMVSSGLTRAPRDGGRDGRASPLTPSAPATWLAMPDLTWAAARNIQEKTTGRPSTRPSRSLAAFSPQKRLVEPDEVAALAVLLASDEARGG